MKEGVGISEKCFLPYLLYCAVNENYGEIDAILNARPSPQLTYQWVGGRWEYCPVSTTSKCASSSAYAHNYCKSLANFWLKNQAEDGSGGLLNRFAEADNVEFIQYSNNKAYISLSDAKKLHFLKELHDIADPESVKIALGMTNSEGKTPYMVARETGHYEVADLYAEWMHEAAPDPLGEAAPEPL